MIKPDQGEIPQDLSQTDVLIRTLGLLRKIRGFPAYTFAQARQFFLDAERSGVVCANLLIVPPDKSVVEEKNIWLKMMAELSTKYSNFPEITVMRSPLEDAAQRVGRTIRTLKILVPTIADSSIQKDFDRSFPFWYEDDLSLKSLCNNKKTVFSPLSTDYLTACMVRRFIEIHVTPDCFRLRPIILDSYLRPVVPPDFIESLGWLESAEWVSVFIENRNTGATRRATWEAVPMPLLPPD